MANACSVGHLPLHRNVGRLVLGCIDAEFLQLNNYVATYIIAHFRTAPKSSFSAAVPRQRRSALGIERMQGAPRRAARPAQRRAAPRRGVQRWAARRRAARRRAARRRAARRRDAPTRAARGATFCRMTWDQHVDHGNWTNISSELLRWRTLGLIDTG